MTTCTRCGGGPSSSSACTCVGMRVVGEFEQLWNKVAALEAEVRELRAQKEAVVQQPYIPSKAWGNDYGF
jgi:hypothetical protein